MKKYRFYWVFVLCILTNLQVFPQMFVSENLQWSILRESFIDTVWQSSTTAHYKFYGDTLIDGNEYKKLLFVATNPENNGNWHVLSFWREQNDSIFRRFADSKDDLIYDFNIQEKDTFYYEGIDEPEIFMVVDSIRNKIWGGKLRKHFYLSRPHDVEHWLTTWIEGVGHLNNPTRSQDYFFTGTFQSLLCFEEGGEVVYQNPRYNSCEVNLTTSSLQLNDHKQLINLYSIADRWLVINLQNENSGTFSLYSPGGRLLGKERISSKETTICARASGVLLYSFVSTKGETQTGKVIVE
jgi:hypothetical protein